MSRSCCQVKPGRKNTGRDHTTVKNISCQKGGTLRCGWSQKRCHVLFQALPPVTSGWQPAVSVKAGVQAALAEAWLNQAPSEVRHNCSVFLSWQVRPQSMRLAAVGQEAVRQVTSQEAAVAGCCWEAGAPAQLHGGQVPLPAQLWGLSCPGCRCQRQQQERGCQSAWELTQLLSSPSSGIWIDFFLLILATNVI